MRYGPISHLFVALVFLSLEAPAQVTAFSYQGRLTEAGNPASGLFDLTFTLHDSPNGGSIVAGPVTNVATPVNNGLFTIAIDFGETAFSGNSRWLGIGVRSNGSSAPFAPLSPRQPITATPYAIHAGRVAAGGVSGTLTESQLPATVLHTNSPMWSNLTATIPGASIAADFFGASAYTPPFYSNAFQPPPFTNSLPDATAAIQAAIDYCAASNGRTNTVKLGAGIYRISAPLRLSGGVNLVGQGQARLGIYSFGFRPQPWTMIWQSNPNAAGLVVDATYGSGYLGYFEVAGGANPLLRGGIGGELMTQPSSALGQQVGIAVVGFEAGGGTFLDHLTATGWKTGFSNNVNSCKYDNCEAVGCDIGFAFEQNRYPAGGDQTLLLMCSANSRANGVGYVVNLAKGLVMVDQQDYLLKHWMYLSNASVSMFGSNNELESTSPWIVKISGWCYVTMEGCRLTGNNTAIFHLEPGTSPVSTQLRGNFGNNTLDNYPTPFIAECVIPWGLHTFTVNQGGYGKFRTYDPSDYSTTSTWSPPGAIQSQFVLSSPLTNQVFATNLVGGLTTNLTVLSAAPATFSTLHFTNGVLMKVTTP